MGCAYRKLLIFQENPSPVPPFPSAWVAPRSWPTQVLSMSDGVSKVCWLPIN